MKLKQFVLRISLLLVLGLFIYGGAMYFGVQDKTTETAFAAPGTLTPIPASDEINQILQTSDELTAKWVEQVTTEEWLYFSYKDDIDDSVVIGDPPVDPDNNWPLPRNSMSEYWYKLDDKGQQTIVVLQRTDLELGNVEQVMWQDGNMLKLPSGIRRNTYIPGRRGWESYRPLWDHFCATQIQYMLSLPEQDNVSISADWVASETGSKQWVLRMSVSYPPVISDAFLNMKVVNNEDVCYRNAETGAVEGSKHYVTSESGEVLLTSWTYDYVTMPLKEPPTEILALLEKLNSGLSE